MEKQILGQWGRTLRPLFWWGLIVLVLLGIHTHQLWMEKTRITFTATLAGLPPAREATATFDGQLIFSGQKIPLGRHQFTVTHPKGESYSTNLFIWYGGKNLGTIDLKRAAGRLVINASEPATTIRVSGPEFSTVLQNSAGSNLAVPTDDYRIQITYPHWTETKPVTVFDRQVTDCVFTPPFGAVSLTCNYTGASYRLADEAGNTVETGVIPATIGGLPAGDYHLVATSRNHQLKNDLRVFARQTNAVDCDFEFGAVQLMTVPAGATVQTEDGAQLGQTPLLLSELPVQTTRFTLELAGYQPVTVPIQIVANRTQTIQTNLVSEALVNGLSEARKYLAAASYEPAIAAINSALNADPRNKIALDLQRQITGLWTIQQAKGLAATGDYLGAGKKLAEALKLLPDNQDARQLQIDYQRRVPEQIARQREERLAWPKKNFDAFIGQVSGAAMFENHEVSTSKSVGEVHAAIVAKLQSAQPPFKIARSDLSPVPEISQINATQTIPGGARRCIIVSSQSKDDETRIYFVVLEAKKIGFMQQPITSLVGATPMEYTLINPRGDLTDKQKTQISEGVSVVTSIIQSAIGQTPAPALP